MSGKFFFDQNFDFFAVSCILSTSSVSAREVLAPLWYVFSFGNFEKDDERVRQRPGMVSHFPLSFGNVDLVILVS